VIVNQNSHFEGDNAVNEFVAAHEADVMGVLEGFDRMVFRGTLSSISYPQGMGRFIGSRKVLYKDYGDFAQGLSERLKRHAQQMAQREGRPFEYVASPSASKERIARRIMDRDGIKEGLICVLSCVEPCRTISIRRNGKTRQLELMNQERRCLHLYFYYLDRTFGFMHVRLQTWLPMPIQVCINGREYLAQRMKQAGIDYEQRENCFVKIDDLPRAQELIDELERLNWPRTLDRYAHKANVLLLGSSGLDLWGYYWTIRESEYATDVMFKDADKLKSIYPNLVDHAMKRLDSRDVMRFLGRRTQWRRFDGEVTSDIQVRSEGMRIKHRVEENSIKMYDKQGSVLRIETTINNPKRLRIWRKVKRRGKSKMAWAAMRKGVADTRRRVASCRAANHRYLQALASVPGPSQPVHRTLDRVSERVQNKDRWFRALRPIAPTDAQVLAAIASGSFILSGFSNRQLRQKLAIPEAKDPLERKRQAAAVSRRLSLLHAHGLIVRIQQTRRWRVTGRGRELISVSQRVRDADITALAA
jgi:hypothetical protein